jgi:hypothetical protein
MSAGPVISRRPRTDVPVIRLGALSPLKSVEPLLQYLQATATQTLDIQAELLDEFKLLRKAVERAIWIAENPNEPLEKIP